ncbi:hypothetical protein GCM10009785_34810 [Brooklawnia cerclae]|uniref:Uncharacterized protein n=1 Tax=Brooklawnia cerclae TaxID=349934 RepID=A0ABX0SN53_9ACTN|nr:hypothetical protein [Brooklawnia cerclae]NIH58470.1 hypothetical protein [Brooklawnia cerclae]
MPATKAVKAKLQTTAYGTPVLRVRDTATGHAVTLKASLVEASKGRYAVVDEPAVDGSGRPLPPVYAPSKPDAEPEADTAPEQEETN